MELSLAEGFSLLVKWRKLILANFLIFSVVAAGVSLILPKWYTSTATLLPPEGQQMINLEMMGMASMPSFSLPTFPGMIGPSDIYMAILRSRNVREGVIKKLNLKEAFGVTSIEDALEILASRTYLDKTEEQIIVISAQARTPQMAQRIVQAYIEELDRVNREVRTSSARYTREFIEQRVAEVEQEMKRAAQALKEFQEKHKAISLEEQTKASIQSAAQLQAQLAMAEINYRVLLKTRDESHPEVQQVLYQIHELRKQLEKFEKGEASDEDEYMIPFSEVPDLAMRLAFLTRDLEVQKALYQLLMEQYEKAKIQEKRDTPTIQVLDSPKVPEKRSRPKRRLIVMVAALLSFFVSGFFIFTYEYVHRLQSQGGEKSAEYQKLRNAFEQLKRDLLFFKKRRA